MKKRIKKILWILLALVILCGLFYVYIQRRTGPDYVRPFPTLLPAETAAYASLKDLTTLWQRFTSLKIYQELAESAELSTLLLSSKDLGKWRKKLTRLEYKTRLKLGREFILKWLGRDVAVAMMPPLKENAPPGILVMSKTRIGFEEKLAELVAQYYPELRLETRKYRGTLINRYRGEKSTRSFSYLRFGRTVFLSLRSTDTALLKQIVDLNLDTSLPRLATQQDFRDYESRASTKGGISVFLRPQKFVQFLKRSQKYSHSRRTEKTLPLLKKLLMSYNYVSLQLALDNGVKASLWLNYSTPLRYKPLLPPDSFDALSYVPADCSAFLGLKDNRLPEILEWSVRTLLPAHQFKNDELNPAEKLALEFAHRLLPTVNREILISLDSIEPGILFPLFVARLMLNEKSPENASKEIGKLFARIKDEKQKGDSSSVLTPIGTLRYANAKDRDFVMLGLNTPESPPKILNLKETPFAHPLFKRVFPDSLARARVILYINLERVKEDLEKVANGSIKWKRKARRRIKRLEKWAAVCGHLRGCGIWDEHKKKGVRYNLLIPLQ